MGQDERFKKMEKKLAVIQKQHGEFRNEIRDSFAGIHERFDKLEELLTGISISNPIESNDADIINRELTELDERLSKVESSLFRIINE